ncbi:MAG: 2-oxoisovalerate dehydrogenase E1 component alpha subunit [Alteromonadaceae bacterium]|jgi:2-oxoisovalerate dehydrogenase E1 component alpha subunit
MLNPNNATVSAVNKPHFIDNGALEFPMYQVLNSDGSVIEGAEVPDIDKDTALKIYETMQFIRVLDDRMVAAQRQGRISFYMQCLGEEAAITGSAAALAQEDMIMSQYREHAALRYRGFTLTQFMDQMFSNEQDLGKGRQMPIHYGSAELNFMTVSSPLATQIPQATGYAYGQKLSGKAECTICYFGEGAASEGDFHAGLNMAAVQRAPVIFFCRNNGYAISTPAAEQFAGDGIASRGLGYGMRTIRVDGSDALAIYHTTKLARQYALDENKPVLIEACAYRLGGHSTSDDPSGYRTKDEENAFKDNDPVEKYKLWLLAKGWLDTTDEVEQMETLRKEILAAVKVAEVIDKPRIEDLITDVYEQPTAHLQAQLDELKQHIKKYPQAYPVTAGRIE